MTFLKAVGNDSLVIYDIFPGKPDPEEERPVKGKDDRPRVEQKRQKGHTCVYYALSFIRDRIGPASSPAFKEERRLEKIASSWRKSITKLGNYNYEKDMPKILDCHKTLYKALGKDFDKEFESFKREFTQHALLQVPAVQVQLGGKYPADKDRVFGDFSDPKAPDHLANFMTYSTVARALGFEDSSYNPHMPVTTLIQILSHEGPIVVSSMLGVHAYLIEPHILKQKIGDLTVRGWTPGAPKAEGSKIGHFITIIGAQKDGDKERVYFIDPNDSSIPGVQRKIYTVSYKTFKENLMSLWGGLIGTSAEFDRQPYAHKRKALPKE
jgi:hypothetical protein